MCMSVHIINSLRHNYVTFCGNYFFRNVIFYNIFYIALLGIRIQWDFPQVRILCYIVSIGQM